MHAFVALCAAAPLDARLAFQRASGRSVAPGARDSQSTRLSSDTSAPNSEDGPTSGNAPYFEPNVNDRAALVKALSDTIAGVRSCVFDLQGKVKINLMLANQGIVEVDGQRVPYGGDDGYRMNSETQLELLGASCKRLKQPETKRVFIDFPCEAVVLL